MGYFIVSRIQNPNIRLICDFRRLARPVMLFIVMLWSSCAYGEITSVALTWNPPVDADTNANISQYIVFYGTRSGVYTNTLMVSISDYGYFGGGVFISSLPRGTTYYFAVSAIDTDGNSSGISTEASLALPLLQRVFLKNEIFTDGNGAPFAMEITGTNSSVTTWEFDYSTNMVNWIMLDQNHTTDIIEDIYLDGSPRMFFRVVDH